MRLTDLDPRWVGILRWSKERPLHIGLSFLCPHCRKQRLAILFDPAVDPTNVASETTWESTATAFPNTTIWQRKGGDSFDTITLSPLIDTGFSGHWHGFIDNGMIC